MALDDIVPAHSITPLAVKIDTQGAEPFVVMGGPRTLGQASLLVVEWAPYWLARLGGDPGIVTTFLERSFTGLAVAEGESGSIPPAEPARLVTERLLEMVRNYIDDPMKYVDVIAYR